MERTKNNNSDTIIKSSSDTIIKEIYTSLLFLTGGSLEIIKRNKYIKDIISIIEIERKEEESQSI